LNAFTTAVPSGTSCWVSSALVDASRHTPPRTPIWVRVDRRDPGALLTVADAGPGMPAEQRERVFQPFHRGPGATTYALRARVRRRPGAGGAVRRPARRPRLGGAADGGASFQVLLPDGPDMAATDPMSSVTG
jgi:hypothetical protein